MPTKLADGLGLRDAPLLSILDEEFGMNFQSQTSNLFNNRFRDTPQNLVPPLQRYEL